MKDGILGLLGFPDGVEIEKTQAMGIAILTRPVLLFGLRSTGTTGMVVHGLHLNGPLSKKFMIPISRSLPGRIQDILPRKS